MHGPSPLESSAQSARAIAHSVLGDVAHVQDEVAYMLQAKTFASLELTSKIGLPRAAFDMWFVDDRTTRHAIFPPGWPALLAIGFRCFTRPTVEQHNKNLFGYVKLPLKSARSSAG